MSTHTAPRRRTYQPVPLPRRVGLALRRAYRRHAFTLAALICGALLGLAMLAPIAAKFYDWA